MTSREAEAATEAAAVILKDRFLHTASAQEFLASALLAVGHVAREGEPVPNTESVTDVPTGLSGHHRATLAPRQQALGKEA